MEDSFFITEEEAGQRLDKVLAARFPSHSRTYFQYLIDHHLVLVGGEVVKKRNLVKAGDEIEIEFALTPESELLPENIPLDILYEDEAIIAVNKPAGLVVHPGAGHATGTFVNGLLYHCKTLPEGNLRPGIVHRLDKDTSGVLLAAKTLIAQERLVAAFAERRVQKEYLAICIGNVGNQLLTGSIGRHPIHRKEMAIVPGGKSAETAAETICFDEQLSYVRLMPKTGRTHQLRVHLKSCGHPILGDVVYGNPSTNKKWGASRQLLHAYQLHFAHPMTGVAIALKAAIPDDMQRFIEKIAKR